MILGVYLITELGINSKISDHAIGADDGPFKGCTAPMVDLGTYELKKNIQRKLHLNDCLRMLMHKKFINRNMSVLLTNDYV